MVNPYRLMFKAQRKYNIMNPLMWFWSKEVIETQVVNHVIDSINYSYVKGC